MINQSLQLISFLPRCLLAIPFQNPLDDKYNCTPRLSCYCQLDGLHRWTLDFSENLTPPHNPEKEDIPDSWVN